MSADRIGSPGLSTVPRLGVREVRVRAVDVPLERPLTTASGVIPASPLVLIDLETDQGVTGCAYLFCYSRLVLEAVARLAANLGQLIAGDPLAPEVIERRLQQRFVLLGPQGLTGMAMAGIEMAAWDALAKAHELPLVRLLGGEPAAIPAYNSIGLEDARTAARVAEESAAQGFGALKIKIGHPTVAGDLEVIRAVRSAVGDGLEVMVDYNQSLSIPEACSRAHVLDAEGVSWIEEPVRADDFAGHALIARQARTPIQIGENWWGPHDMAKSIAAQASDLVMVDAMKIGGVSGWLRASALANAAGLPVSSHIFPEISAHLLAVTPGVHWLEYLDAAGPILSQPVQVRSGMVTASAEPGSGIGWDEDAVRRHQVL